MKTSKIPLWWWTMGVGMLVLTSTAPATEPVVVRGTPVPVTFGVRALRPETPVNPQVAFVSQPVRLPAATCAICHDDDSWRRSWSVSHMTLDRDNSREAQGWYVFRSGLTGIGISVQVETPVALVTTGQGQAPADGDTVTVGLVRLAQETGVGLAALPPAEFVRITTFTGADGTIREVQEDTLRVSADLRVPTCTSLAGSLHFTLPAISQRQLRQAIGDSAEGEASVPQRIVANCSANIQVVRIRFMPSGNVSDSVAGLATVLVGQDSQGQDSGVGYLLRYEAQAFGRVQRGVVSWDPARPLVLTPPQSTDDGQGLREDISVTLQAFYARAQNVRAITPGSLTAKGLYQVSYD